ncbi:MAG: sulfate ABC transporter permease subunit CysW [Lentisphaerae bacterium]|nr:sulfate ABC transporter permease subunit CysW [Lentisphaerota bacterium]
MIRTDRHSTRFAFHVVVGTLAVLTIAVILVLPLGIIVKEAFSKGFAAWWNALRDADTLSAVKLTLLTTAIVVPVNTVMGVVMAWAIAKFDFKGRTFLISLIDLPFAVSPIVAGLIFILLLGPRNGWIGPWLDARGIRLVFSTAGVIIATLFVTFPFVVRELIPLMREQGTMEEQAALSLGASPWKMFWRVTLPNIRWGLLYGVILCLARSVGEFGAVSVVSGHIRGETNTLPLHVEILYNEYSFTAAFAAASVLSLVAVVTITVKSFLERRIHRKGA